MIEHANYKVGVHRLLVCACTGSFISVRDFLQLSLQIFNRSLLLIFVRLLASFEQVAISSVTFIRWFSITMIHRTPHWLPVLIMGLPKYSITDPWSSGITIPILKISKYSWSILSDLAPWTPHLHLFNNRYLSVYENNRKIQLWSCSLIVLPLSLRITTWAVLWTLDLVLLSCLFWHPGAFCFTAQCLPWLSMYFHSRSNIFNKLREYSRYVSSEH